MSNLPSSSALLPPHTVAIVRGLREGALSREVERGLFAVFTEALLAGDQREERRGMRMVMVSVGRRQQEADGAGLHCASVLHRCQRKGGRG